MKHIEVSRMTGRTVLVTGATSGIGRATALGLATMGANVAMTGRDRQRTESAAREISAAGGRKVEIFVADLSSHVPLLRPMMKSSVQGAATSIQLASALELEKVSGQYFAGRRPRRSSTRSHDQAVGVRLWEASADLVSRAAAPRV